MERCGISERFYDYARGGATGLAVSGVNRLWQRRYEVDAGVKPGVTTEAAAEIKRLQKENVELRKANEVLKAASVFFAKELDRPSTR